MANASAPRPGVDGEAPSIDMQVGPYEMTVATAFGPRILGLRLHGGPELFARLADDIVIEHPDAGVYRFHGGHRLWAAPENPRITYASDDHRCEVMPTATGFTIRAPADQAGIIKELTVTPDGDKILVDHHLANSGPIALSIAAWGITQFPLGGIAILPVDGPLASNPYQANSSLVVWPYSNLTDSRLSWIERGAVVDAVIGPRLKIGSGPRPGRLGYLKDGYLFTKTITAAESGEYPDRGAVGQVFVEDAFCELESLGPINALEPGASISHCEVWGVTDCPGLSTACQRVLGEAHA